jgi:hypothetical protein
MIVISYHQLEGLTIEILYLVKLNCHCSVLIEDIISLNMESRGEHASHYTTDEVSRDYVNSCQTPWHLSRFEYNIIWIIHNYRFDFLISRFMITFLFIDVCSPFCTLTIEILYLVKLNCHCSVLIEDIISLNMEWISNISYKMVNRHQ